MLGKRLTRVLTRKLGEHARIVQENVRAYGIEHEIRQHQWREKEDDLEKSKVTDDPEKPKQFLWFPTHAPSQGDFSFGNLKNWYGQAKIANARKRQAFIPERHQTLGPDIATAQFIVHRGGKVKFHEDDHWIERKADGTFDIPFKYDPSYLLEAVDVNGFDLHYEGLSNFCGLGKLKWLSFKGCRNIDDWGLDKISAEFPRLEYFDISDCEKITERGLESLYRLFKLKMLIVTNHHKSVAFELTCMMLEDCLPGLTCKILLPPERPEERS